MTATTHRLYCICGAKVEARSQPPAAAALVVDWFLGRHSGTGHALTDARTAGRNRRRNEAMADKGDAILRAAFR